jgi:hypothetical protein
MKILDLALNVAIVLFATIFFAYVGLYHFDFGLFVTLPGSITAPFIRVPALQYVALGVAIGALIAKVPVGRAIKRQEAERRI